jgi:two-component system, cell cycle response regulator DivK
MAGETIMVVDDAPVNLKLTDIVLSKEGYKVRTVSDAEEALRALDTFRSDVMLVDIQLPGMSGLELTRRVKQDRRTNDIVVIALTAHATREDEAKAFAAGCDGYITKPIDTRTLGPRIRELLAGHAPAGPAAAPSLLAAAPSLPAATPSLPAAAPSLPAAAPSLPEGLSLSSVEMESLRRRFLEEGITQSRQMLEHFDRQQAQQLLHKWVGSAGVLGYYAIAGLASELETLLTAPEGDPAALDALLGKLATAFSDPLESRISLPDSIMKELENKRVAMVGFPRDEAERLCSIFAYMGAVTHLFDSSVPPQSELVRTADAVMVNARPETIDEKWFDPKTPPPLGLPLLLVGARDVILALDSEVQARACEFLIDGWQPEEAVMRLSFALTRAVRPAPKPAKAGSPARGWNPAQTLERARVVLADDDPAVAAVLCSTLRQYNVDCRVASSGDEALRLVHLWQPTAAVLDVNMPGMSGFEVLSAIRVQELPVKVILLTALRQESDVVHGFDLGADDYVPKPFSAVEVVMRLKRVICK